MDDDTGSETEFVIAVCEENGVAHTRIQRVGAKQYRAGRSAAVFPHLLALVEHYRSTPLQSALLANGLPRSSVSGALAREVGKDACHELTCSDRLVSSCGPFSGAHHDDPCE
jgi:hypothetical protein